MFGKLLKYDLKYLFRKEKFLLLGFVLLTFFTRLLVVINGKVDVVAISIFTGFLELFVAVGAIALLASVFVITIKRFNNNVLGDEGYLTHTLPVNKSSILLSKLFSNLIISAIAVILVIFLLPYVFVGVDFYKGIPAFLESIFESLSEAKSGFVIGFSILLVLNMILSTLFSTILIPMCQTCASTSNNHRVIMTVLYLFISWMIVQVVNTAALTLVFFVAKHLSTNATLLITLGVSATLVACGTIIAYFITLYILKKRLRLK